MVRQFVVGWISVTAAVATFAHDQSATAPAGVLPVKPIVCRTEVAAIRLIQATASTGAIDGAVLNGSIKQGDCLPVKDGWTIASMIDPSASQPDTRAAEWVIDTPAKKLIMWTLPGKLAHWNPPQAICRSRAAMQQWINAEQSGSGAAAQQALITSGSCTHVLYESIKSVDGNSSPAKVRVQTPDGLVTRWGYGVGE
ncbi:hypothetical protein [Dyella acidiphila]|uniref:Uncharacterized protein n=1 Tax=Dyella acidiphila TaxID=2775866 RepID=A0ABR9GDF2_9GAMM|nr:hypothetical protein [Dyella acidiphila]MBE1162073.1 hypothetical protein [Dyella acidiphila]